jgi:hypothetical protein
MSCIGAADIRYSTYLKTDPDRLRQAATTGQPHHGMGMLGVVAVSDPVNLAEAKAVPQKGKAKKRFEDLFGNVGQ